MICLLDSEETPDVGFITQFRRTRRGYRGVTVRDAVILGVRTLVIKIDWTPSIQTKTVQKRIQCAAEQMRAAHVTKVLFSKSFQYRELILREGFVEADDSILTESLAGKVASAFSGTDKAAAFFASRLSASAERAFYDMCRDFRYVMAAVESDAARLFSAYAKRLGISVLGQPTEQQLLRADVAVFFDPPGVITVLPEKCVAVPVNARVLDGVVCSKAVTGLTVELPVGKTSELPDGFDHKPLIAYAMETGTIRREDVRLSQINIADMHIRNGNDLTKF